MSISPCNLAVLSGCLSSPPRRRALESGSVLLNLEVTVAHPDARADTVPVSVFDPAAAVERLAEGDAVVVVGAVRRRFYRTPTGTASRTEVVAESVLPAGRKAAANALANAASELATVAD